MKIREKIMTLVKQRPAPRSSADKAKRLALIRSLIRHDKPILDRLADK